MAVRDTDTIIATRSNANSERGGIYSRTETLVRLKNGNFAIRETRGGAIASSEFLPRFDRAGAIEWIATEALDPVTGYGYSREQAEIMVDGGEAGKGYRD